MERVLGRALSVDEAVGIALETQPAIQARLADYQAAASRVDQVFSPLLPQLSGFVGATRSQTAQSFRRQDPFDPRTSNSTLTSIRPFGESLTATVTALAADLRLRQDVRVHRGGPAPGRGGSGRRRATAAGRHVVREAERSSIINFAQRLIRVQEQALERADLNLRSARGFFEVGTRPKSDVARAEVDVANARVDLIRARNAERAGARRPQHGHGHRGRHADSGPGQPRLPARFTLDRPQLQAQALAAAAGVQADPSARGRGRGPAAAGLPRLLPRRHRHRHLRRHSHRSQRGLGDRRWRCTWTLFDGGNRIARSGRRKAIVESAKARVKATELDIARKSSRRSSVVNEAEERIGATQTAVASAQENFRLAQGRFDAGVGTILELTDAQLFLTQAQNTEAQALADYRIALAAAGAGHRAAVTSSEIVRLRLARLRRLMKRIVSLVVVAVLVGAGVWGYFYAQSRGSCPEVPHCPRRARSPHRGRVGHRQSQRGHHRPGRQPGLGPDQGADGRLQHAREEEPGHRADRPRDLRGQGQPGPGRRRLRPCHRRSTRRRRSRRPRPTSRTPGRRWPRRKANTAKAQVAVVDAKRDSRPQDASCSSGSSSPRATSTASQAAHDSALALRSTRPGPRSSRSAAGDPVGARAQLRVTEAMLQSARAQVDQKKAALVQAQVDLEHTTIRAPVNGVVVSRAVDVGQTVAASLQAPMLFTIAEDLTKMQVEVSVDEADIGRIKLEDRATFTVDSFPGQTFAGVVTQIRKAAQVVQNVVTYTVVVAVDNPGGRLLPGMTANVKMIVAEKPNVLKVPNAALRFRPAGSDGAPAAGARGGAAARPAARTAQARVAVSEAPERGGGGRPSLEQIRERLVKSLDAHGGAAEEARSRSCRTAASRCKALQRLPEAGAPARGQQDPRGHARCASARSSRPSSGALRRVGRRRRGGGGGDPRSGAPGRVCVARRRQAQAGRAHARHQRRRGDRGAARRAEGGPGRSSSAPAAPRPRPAGGQRQSAPRPRL